MSAVIKIENVSKQYRLGTIGTGSLSNDLLRWWHQVRGKEDPFLKIGEENDRTVKGESDYVWALNNISFDVQQSDVVGIIGKNGSGKSTLLKLLSRTTLPTTGSIKIRGRIASLLEVGTGFHPELTGRENIFLNGAILGMSKSEIISKFDEIVDFAGVEKYIDTPVKRYSSGMYVRLAFAVAAYLEPEILVVDEVLAVGDAEFQKKAIGKMKDVSDKEGRTVLFVSHNMGAIRDLCTTGIYLENGSLNAVGKADEIVKLYLETLQKVSGLKPLKMRTDRKGSNQVIIEEVVFYDFKTKRQLDTLISGDDVVIELKYRSKNSDIIMLNNVVFGFAVHTSGQQFITPINNLMADRAFDTLPPSGSVFCRINSFPFMFGEFTAHLGLMVNNELMDYIENGCWFKVESGDFYKSGTVNANNRQGVFIPQEWSKVFDW